MPSGNDIISVTEAAKLCKVTRMTIWRWIRSGQLNAGATAGGHFRVKRADLDRFFESREMAAQSRKERAEACKILIVDDDSSIRRLLGEMLAREGYDLDYAGDGFEAGIKMVKFDPDLMILDLYMPEMNGFEVCRRLKENSDTSAIKIIAISGYDTKENETRILDCGADLFFAKPLEKRVLVRGVQRLMERA